MARLTAAARRKLPASEFALSKGHYPMDTRARAVAAEGRATQFASPSQRAKIFRAVHAKYPTLGKDRVK